MDFQRGAGPRNRVAPPNLQLPRRGLYNSQVCTIFSALSERPGQGSTLAPSRSQIPAAWAPVPPAGARFAPRAPPSGNGPESVTFPFRGSAERLRAVPCAVRLFSLGCFPRKGLNTFLRPPPSFVCSGILALFPGLPRRKPCGYLPGCCRFLREERHGKREVCCAREGRWGVLRGGGGGGCRLYFNVIIVAVATHWITPPGMNLVTMVGLREIGKCATEGRSYITANNSEGLTCDPSNYTDDTSMQLPPPLCGDVTVGGVWGGGPRPFWGTAWWEWGLSPPEEPEEGNSISAPGWWMWCQLL